MLRVALDEVETGPEELKVGEVADEELVRNLARRVPRLARLHLNDGTVSVVTLARSPHRSLGQAARLT